MKARLLIASCVIALAACATTGASLTADGVEEGLDAAVQIAATLYQAKKINDADVKAIVDAANAIYATAEASRSTAAVGDTSTSAAQLRAAAAALDALTASLAAKQGK